MTAWGYNPSRSGLETGNKTSVSYVLRQDKINLVLTSPLQAGGPINDHINRHGDGGKRRFGWTTPPRATQKPPRAVP